MEQEEVRCRKAEHQEEVPSDHVRRETQCKRHWAEQEDLEHLDRGDQDVQELRDPWWEQLVLQVATHAEALNTGGQVDQERPERNNNRQGTLRGTCNVEEWNDSRDVECQDGKEHRGQHGKVLARVVAENLFGDVYSHEVQRHFCNVLTPAWYELGTTSGKQEQDDQNSGGNDLHQVNAVELDGADFEDGCRKEFID